MNTKQIDTEVTRVEEPPSPEEVMILRMVGGVFTNGEYITENLSILRASKIADGVYGFAHYPMAKTDGR